MTHFYEQHIWEKPALYFVLKMWNPKDRNFFFKDGSLDLSYSSKPVWMWTI